MVNKTQEILHAKIIELRTEHNELVEKYNSIKEKHNEMVPHINQAQLMATQGGRFSGPSVPRLIENFARHDSGNEDFTMKQFNEWKKELNTLDKRLDALTFTLSTLREIRDGSKTKTEKK